MLAQDNRTRGSGAEADAGAIDNARSAAGLPLLERLHLDAGSSAALQVCNASRCVMMQLH